jgi:hypothetical protein
MATPTSTSGGTTVDPTIAQAFANLTLLGSQRTQLQTFTDHAVLERMLIQGGDPSNYADLQTASHVPTPQPYVVPNFVQPTGKPVGS